MSTIRLLVGLFALRIQVCVERRDDFLLRALAVVALVAALVMLVVTPEWAASASTREASPLQVAQKIRAVFHSERSVRIARCESRTERRQLDPRAVGDAGELGIFQIHPIHFNQPARRGSKLIIRASRLFDVDYNIRVAFEMSGGGRNWRPWTCSRKVA